MEQTSVPIRSATRWTICSSSSRSVWARAMISLIISRVVSFSRAMSLTIAVRVRIVILYYSAPTIQSRRHFD